MYSRDATIMDFVEVYSLRNNHSSMIIMHLLILQHKITLFIATFWNRNDTVTNNIAQNNNTKEKKSISLIGIKKVTSAL